MKKCETNCRKVWGQEFLLKGCLYKKGEGKIKRVGFDPTANYDPMFLMLKFPRLYNCHSG